MLLVVAATESELAGVAGAAPVCVCGIGPVEAAAATAAALASERPGAVLHIGLAGARRGSGIEAPALVIGSEALYEDITGQLAPRRAIADAALLNAARRALPDARVLTIGTSASVGGTSAAPIEAMEGFAVLRAAERAGVPAVEIRAVANEIEEPDRGRWRIAEALEALGNATPALVETLLPCAS